jgi:hypothetical protein
MKLADIGDVLTMGILNGAIASTYDVDSTLYVLDWQSFQAKGEQEEKALDRYFKFGLKASRFSEEQLTSIRPFFLVYYKEGVGEIHTGLYDTVKKEIRTPAPYLVCIDEDADWKYLYKFFISY